MDIFNAIILNMVRPGNTVKIIPVDERLDLSKVFTVQGVSRKAFIYGITENCDGYEMQYKDIKEIRIIS